MTDLILLDHSFLEIKNISKKKNKNALLLRVKKENNFTLKNLNLGVQRINYLQSDIFGRSIVQSLQFQYFPKSNFCMIFNETDHTFILECIKKTNYISKNTRIGIREDLRLNKKCCKKLEDMVYTGYNLDKGSLSQKEQGGSLIMDKNNELVIGEVTNGENEEVIIQPTPYSFHTHPRDAYRNHKVKNAWPSLSDLAGFLRLNKYGGQAHFVATIEGLYCISGVYSVPKDTVKPFLENIYKTALTPSSFVSEINAISKLITLDFKPWSLTPKKSYKITKIIST
jgi:hypothetical protein